MAKDINASNRKRSSNRSIFIFLLALLIALFIFVWPKHKSKDKTEGGKGKSGIANVYTAAVDTANIPISLNAIGTVEALETVSIQPQITGQLKKVYFKQGQFVKKGQLLFEIDPRLQKEAVFQYVALAARSKAAVQQSQANIQKSSAQIAVAEANLKRDQAQLHFAQIQEERYRNLLAKNYVTREQYEQLKTSLTVAQATVAADQAALTNTRAQVLSDRAAIQTAVSSAAADQATLEAAKIQLGFTQIYSPISGKTGPLLINVGNNLMANTSTLVTIERFSPILVGFSVPEKNLLDVRKALSEDKRLPVTATVQDNKAYKATGRLVFIDNTVNPNTGMVRLKSEFLNGDHLLWPGRFVNIEMDLGIQHNALLVPASAVQNGQNGDFVYVVENNQARLKPIVVNRIVGDWAVLTRGLMQGETVVTEGQLKLASGVKVRNLGSRVHASPAPVNSQPVQTGAR